MEAYGVATSVFAVVCGWILYRWFREFYWFWGSPSHGKLPPGSAGLPLLGCTLDWYFSVSSSHPPAFVEALTKRFGKIFRCNLFGRPTVISADPKFNKYILQNEGKLLKASYPKSFRDLVGKNGLIAIHGELHRKLHTIAAGLMTPEKLKSHFICDIQLILNLAMNSWQNGQVFFEDECRKLAINLMVNQLLGAYTVDEINEMAPHCYDFVDGVISIPINVPGTKYHTAMKARRTLINLICKSMSKRSSNSSAQPFGAPKNGLLIRLMEEEKLPDEVVADFLISLLFAGHETTAKTMAFAIYFLTQNPRALEDLRNEQNRLTKSGDGMLNWEDYKCMPFTQCVINETLRLGGIAISVFRETLEEINYNDIVIPKGWMVMPFFSAVHLNGDFYEDPLTFNPWRWQETEAKNRHWRNCELYMPYGSGVRLCPGAELARLQISMFLHYFVTKFRWEQVKEDRPSYFPSAKLVGRFPIRLERVI